MAFWVDDFPNFPRWDMYPFPRGYEFHKSRIKYDHTFLSPKPGDFWEFLERRPCCGPIPRIDSRKTPSAFVTKQASPQKRLPVSSECTAVVCFDNVMSLCSQFSLILPRNLNENSAKIHPKSIKNQPAWWPAQGGAYGRACCRKALVLCPASLVKNWAGETWLLQPDGEKSRVWSCFSWDLPYEVADLSPLHFRKLSATDRT